MLTMTSALDRAERQYGDRVAITDGKRDFTWAEHIGRVRQAANMLGELGIKAVELEEFHGDPADRFIVATTILEGGTLVTADEAILGWSGELVCHDARN